MIIIGIDLSGPRNLADTSMAVFEQRAGVAQFMKACHGAGDNEILRVVSDVGSKQPLVIGIDAPLSYNPGGGDRPSDAALRHAVLEKGRGVGVMPPTLMRMVYLTLRGITLTRMLGGLRPQIEPAMVEVHPGACMLLREAPAQDVAAFKRAMPARVHLLEWLQRMGLQGLPSSNDPSDHFVAACAAGLA